MRRLEGKACVITGAGGGMGREAAIVFTAEGARVCVADVDLDAAEETASLCGVEAFAARVDVSDEEDVRATMNGAAQRFGGVDVLYNNAGISPADDGSVLETSVEAWQRVQDVNTKGVFLCCKHGIPHLLARGGGSVVNVASFVAILGAATSQISYTASKGAVLALSRELAVEFARRGVRVNALCPGPVETPLLLAIYGDDPAAFERRRVHRGADVVLVRNVDARRERLAAAERDGLLRRVEVDVGDTYPCALRREDDRSLAAHPTARAGDHARLAVEPPHWHYNFTPPSPRTRSSAPSTRPSRPCRARGRCRPDRERYAVRPLRVDLDARRGTRNAGRPGAGGGGPVGQFEQLGPCADAVRRHEDVRLRPRARHGRHGRVLGAEERVRGDGGVKL